MCDLLAETGVAGKPNSFFRKESFVEWANYFDVPATQWKEPHDFDQSYLSAVLKEGSGGTSVFGMRLMWESVADLSKELDGFHPNLPNDNSRFQATFGTPLYIHLSRKDKVAQAISHLKAEQSGLWHVFADGSERERLAAGRTPKYDASQISMLLSKAEEDDLAWIKWFAEQKVKPLSIFYEDLASSPQYFLGTILSSLGLDPKISKTVKVITSKLADDQSLEWISRFRRESSNT